MRRLKAVLFAFVLVALSFAYAGSSEVRPQAYTYAYELAKDSGRDTVFVICGVCPSISRLALRQKEIPPAIKVIVPEVKVYPPTERLERR